MLKSPKQLTAEIKNMIEFAELPLSDKMEYDPYQLNINGIRDTADLKTFLIHKLFYWHFYLYYYEQAENFEICAKIRTAIDIELDEVRRLHQTYLTYSDYDDEFISLCDERVNKAVRENYKMYLEIYQKEGEI